MQNGSIKFNFQILKKSIYWIYHFLTINSLSLHHVWMRPKSQEQA